MQFYKKRDFGTFISDSFGFFRSYGKNYFKNYILLNGLLLILLGVIGFVGFRDFFGKLYGSNLSGNMGYIEQYFEENMGPFIFTGILMFLLYSALLIINFLFPVFYVKRVSKGSLNIKTDEIINDFKTNAGKIFKLYLGIIFLIIPGSVFLLGISGALMIVLIGFVLILFVIPTLFNVVTFLTYDYFDSNRGFFGSLSYAMRSQFSYANGRESSPFWKYWGASIILGIIYYVITLIFSVVPRLFFYGSLFTTTPDANFEQNPFTGTMGVIFFVLSIISAIGSMILMNLLYVNSGLMYYDSRTDLHQQVELAEIDTIGINE